MCKNVPFSSNRDLGGIKAQMFLRKPGEGGEDLAPQPLLRCNLGEINDIKFKPKVI